MRYADAVGTSVAFAFDLTTIPAGFLDDEAAGVQELAND